MRVAMQTRDVVVVVAVVKFHGSFHPLLLYPEEDKTSSMRGEDGEGKREEGEEGNKSKAKMCTRGKKDILGWIGYMEREKRGVSGGEYCYPQISAVKGQNCMDIRGGGLPHPIS